MRYLPNLLIFLVLALAAYLTWPLTEGLAIRFIAPALDGFMGAQDAHVVAKSMMTVLIGAVMGFICTPFHEPLWRRRSQKATTRRSTTAT